MTRAELLGQHSHQTVCGVQVHVYRRDGKFLARGRYRGAAFGETLGSDPLQASSRLRRLLSEIEESTFIRPSEGRHRTLRTGLVPRLDLRRLCDDFLVEARKRRGKRTADTYLARLAPALRFAVTQAARRRWPLAIDLDRQFVVELRAALFEATVTRNGRAGGSPKVMSPRQVLNVLATLRAVLAWAARPDVRKLPAEFVNPLTPDVVGTKSVPDPLRRVKLPLELRTRLVRTMDRSQLCHLALSLVLPLRPDEATGLLVEDVDFARKRLVFGTRLGGRDFTKGRRSFEVPFPPEMVPLLKASIAGREAGPLLREREVFEGRSRPTLLPMKAKDVETAFEAALADADRGTVLTEQDAKATFRGVLRKMGGVSRDALAREFGELLRRIGDAGIRFYDSRAAVTTEMNRAGVPELELRYVTGHATGDILNSYVSLDPDAAMAVYYGQIRPLLEAIAERWKSLEPQV